MSFDAGGFGEGDFGTTPFYTTAGIIDAVLKATAHSNPESQSLKRATILTSINNIYQDVCMDRPWRWLQQSYDISFYAPYSEGTVSITQGSDTVTATGASFVANFVNPRSIFRVGTTSTIYHVAEILSPVSLRLETPFAEDTVTDVTYEIGRNVIRLPREVDSIQPIIIDGQVKMQVTGPSDLRYAQSRNPSYTGRPFMGSVTWNDTDNRLYLEVYPTPDKRYNALLPYKASIEALEDSEDSTPLIPDTYRAVLFYGALAEFLYPFMKDPVGSAKAEARYLRFLIRMQNDKRLSDDEPSISPARNYRRRSAVLGSKSYLGNIEDYGRDF